MLCYKEEFLVELRRHWSAWFPRLSACRFAEFGTSVICHVFMHYRLISFARYVSRNLLSRDKI